MFVLYNAPDKQFYDNGNNTDDNVKKYGTNQLIVIV